MRRDMSSANADPAPFLALLGEMVRAHRVPMDATGVLWMLPAARG